MPSKYAHLYLGYSYDPQPVFRDTHPRAHDWPEGAVFAITVSVMQIMGRNISFGRRSHRTRYYGADGWPLDFPENRKGDFFNHSYRPEFYRGLFQRYPLTHWQTWREGDWELARRFYQHRMCNCIGEMTIQQFHAMRYQVAEDPIYEHLRKNPRTTQTSDSPAPLTRIRRIFHLLAA